MNEQTEKYMELIAELTLEVAKKGYELERSYIRIAELERQLAANAAVSDTLDAVLFFAQDARMVELKADNARRRIDINAAILQTPQHDPLWA